MLRIIRLKNAPVLCLLPALWMLLDGDARADDLYTLGVATSSTSDDIDLNTLVLGYRNNRRDFFWPYQESADTVWDWGFDLHRRSGSAEEFDFTGSQLEVMIGRRIGSQSYVRLSAGIHHLDVSDLNQRKEQFSYNAFALLELEPQAHITLETEDDYIYQDGIQPGGVKGFLNAKKSAVGLEWEVVDRIRVLANSSVWKLSDSNRRRQHTASLLYGISPGWPWIWSGVAYEALSYEDDNADYWTPTKFRSVGLVFDASFPVTDNVSAAVAVNVNKVKEDDHSQGDGGYLSLNVDYNLTSRHILRFESSRIQSAQENSDWSENIYSVSINGSLQ